MDCFKAAKPRTRVSMDHRFNVAHRIELSSLVSDLVPAAARDRSFTGTAALDDARSAVLLSVARVDLDGCLGRALSFSVARVHSRLRHDRTQIAVREVETGKRHSV